MSKLIPKHQDSAGPLTYNKPRLLKEEKESAQFLKNWFNNPNRQKIYNDNVREGIQDDIDWVKSWYDDMIQDYVPMPNFLPNFLETDDLDNDMKKRINRFNMQINNTAARLNKEYEKLRLASLDNTSSQLNSNINSAMSIPRYVYGESNPHQTEMDQQFSNSNIGAYYSPIHEYIAYRPDTIKKSAIHEITHAAHLNDSETKIKKIIKDLHKIKPINSYYDNPDEIYARLMQLREHLNIDPNKKWTIEEIQDLQDKQHDTLLNFRLDKFSYPPEILLQFFNDVAHNNSSENTSEPLYAKKGEKLIPKHQDSSGPLEIQDVDWELIPEYTEYSKTPYKKIEDFPTWLKKQIIIQSNNKNEKVSEDKRSKKQRDKESKQGEAIHNQQQRKELESKVNKGIWTGIGLVGLALAQATPAAPYLDAAFATHGALGLAKQADEGTLGLNLETGLNTLQVLPFGIRGVKKGVKYTDNLIRKKNPIYDLYRSSQELDPKELYYYNLQNLYQFDRIEISGPVDITQAEAMVYNPIHGWYDRTRFIPQIKSKTNGSLELFQRTPTTQQNTWIKPFQTNMGEIDLKTSTISGHNFGKLLGEGSEQSVYLHPTDPSKVLKVYSDIGHTSLNDLRKFVKQYQTRNNVPFQLETKFQGYVTDKSGKMYPVFSQQKVNNVLPNDSKNWVSNITPRLNKQMESIGYTNSHGNYVRGNRRLTDVQPLNITELPNGEFRFIDIFPEGFRKGGKICKIN